MIGLIRLSANTARIALVVRPRILARPVGMPSTRPPSRTSRSSVSSSSLQNPVEIQVHGDRSGHPHRYDSSRADVVARAEIFLRARLTTTFGAGGKLYASRMMV
jgi:hypothetical protein